MILTFFQDFINYVTESWFVQMCAFLINDRVDEASRGQLMLDEHLMFAFRRFVDDHVTSVRRHHTLFLIL